MVIKHRRFKQLSLEERLAEETARFVEQAKVLPPGLLDGMSRTGLSRRDCDSYVRDAPLTAAIVGE